MGRILYLIAAILILYATCKVSIQPPPRKNPAYVAGWYTGSAVCALAGVYCLFKAGSSRT
jgi:hypothetical protein